MSLYDSTLRRKHFNVPFKHKNALPDGSWMAGAPKKAETKLIRMRVSRRLYAYLGVLARRTPLGASENDVAQFLLTQRLEAMWLDRYHDIEIPEDGA